MAVMIVRSYTRPATLRPTACSFTDPSRCADVSIVTDAASTERVHAEERLRGRCHACKSSLHPLKCLMVWRTSWPICLSQVLFSGDHLAANAVGEWVAKYAPDDGFLGISRSFNCKSYCHQPPLHEIFLLVTLNPIFSAAAVLLLKFHG